MMTRWLLPLLLLVVLFVPSWTRSSEERKDSEVVPASQVQPGVDEKAGDYIPLTATFLDQNGKRVTLEQLIDRPTLFLPVYYYCPTSCSLDMANLAQALQAVKASPDSFQVITMSFDESEGVDAARHARKNHTALLKKEYPEDFWYFLTGNKKEIMRVTQAIGYHFLPAPNNTFVHPSAIAVLAGYGKIIKYVYGSFLPGDIDLAIVEAEKGVVAKSIRRFLAFCFNTDPKQNQKVFTFLRIAALLVLGAGAFFFFRFLVKGRDD